MFGNRRLGGMVGLGLSALYAWRNRSRISELTSGISGRFGRKSHVGSEYAGSDMSSSASSSSDIDNMSIGSGNKRSGAV